jgi:HemY protein
MIRVVTYLFVIALLAFGAVWMADRPGDVAITWLDRRIETSVMVLAAVVLAFAVVTTIAWSMVRALMRLPGAMVRRRQTRRGVRGYLAVSRGLIAVGSGDVIAARRFTEEANRFAPDEPLTLLLSAQTAQLRGDREGAARSFELMAERADTRVLGLHGLYIEARRRNDPGAALAYAEQAASNNSVPEWAGQAALEFRCAAGDWAGALDRLERNRASGLLDKASYRSQRAVVLTAQAGAAQTTDRNQAQVLALEAVALVPSLVPAAALAGTLLAESGDQRRAARLIEAAWRANPHPDLARVYVHLYRTESARQRLARIEGLAAKSPGHLEAALAVARAALDAKEFAIARQALAPLTAAPTRRVAALMSEVEQVQHGDEGRAREWMVRALNARRDPAWTADGFVSEQWLPISPISGRLGAFEWTTPHGGEGPGGVVIEAEQIAMLAVRRGVPATSTPSPSQQEVVDPVGTTGRAAAEGWPQPNEPAMTDPGAEHTHSADASGPASTTAARSISTPQRTSPVPLAPAVIPLVHAPDDPGPEVDAQDEPEAEPNEGANADSWTRIRQLFGH